MFGAGGFGFFFGAFRPRSSQHHGVSLFGHNFLLESWGFGVVDRLDLSFFGTCIGEFVERSLILSDSSSDSLQRVRVPLPEGFSSDDASRVEAAVSKKLGGSFRLHSIDSSSGHGVFVRRIEATTTVTAQGVAGKRVMLAPSDCTANGAKAAATIAEDYPGYEIYEYQPHLQRAVIMKMDAELSGARAAVAQALGVRPWEVKVAHRDGGGFRLVELPAKYTPSKHDKALGEAACTKVPGGHPGWFVRVDGRSLSGEIVPAELPTFPALVKPRRTGKRLDVNFSPFGVALPEPGSMVYREVGVDWTASNATILAGLPGSGKRQPLSTRIPVPVSAKFPDGWATMGSLQVGDDVFVPSGKRTRIVEKTRSVRRPTYRFHLIDGREVDSDAEHFWLASTSLSRAKAGKNPSFDVETMRGLRRRAKAAAGRGTTTIHELPVLFGLSLPVMRALVEQLEGPEFDLTEVSKVVLAYFDRQEENHSGGLMMVTTAQIVSSLHLGWALPTSRCLEGPELSVSNLREAGTQWMSGETAGFPDGLLRAARKNRIAFLRGACHGRAHLSRTGQYSLEAGPEQVPVLLELARSLGFFAFRVDGGVGIVTNEKLLPVAESLLISKPVEYVPIDSADFLGDTLGCCIRVEDDCHMYLTEDFIPTHNTVTVNEVVAHQIEAGAELVIVDTPDKSMDFEWAKEYVCEGGWGCKDLRSAVTAVTLAYERGKQRAKILREAGVVKWLDLPPESRFAPITVFVDEWAALTMTTKVPAGLPKDHPLKVSLTEENLFKVQLVSVVNKIIAEQRAHGTRVFIGNQVTNRDSGMPPTMKMKMGNKLLQGVRPSPQARAQLFSDANAIPVVPDNVATDKSVFKGVGVYEMEGYGSSVYKSYYHPVDELGARLASLNLPKAPNIYPSVEDINRICPSDLFEDEDDDWTPSRLETEGGFGKHSTGKDPKLRGAADAAHQLLIQSQQTQLQGKQG